MKPENITDFRIKDAVWYTPQGACIGIVLVETIGGHKAYIGVGSGFDATSDSRRIALNGVPFYHADSLWPNITSWA